MPYFGIISFFIPTYTYIRDDFIGVFIGDNTFFVYLHVVLDLRVWCTQGGVHKHL